MPLVDALARSALVDIVAPSVRRDLVEMGDRACATTNNRLVLGTMNDFSNATYGASHGIMGQP